jgi:hypothetical protein
MLVKRTKGRAIKHGIMARTGGVFENKKKRKHKDGTRKGEDSGGRGRGKMQKIDNKIRKKHFKKRVFR